ncbi:Crossover junction endonuclease mus81 [Glugoides intestinalis]
MDFKTEVIQALKNIIRVQTRINSNSRFLFIKILKMVNEAAALDTWDDLQKLKFVKEKSYKKILEEVNKTSGLAKPTENDTYFDNLIKKYGNPKKQSQIEPISDKKEKALKCASETDFEYKKIDLPEAASFYSDSSIVIYKEEEKTDTESTDLIVIADAPASDAITDLEKVFTSLSELTIDDIKSNGITPSNSFIKEKKRRRYVPGYRTASYAILKALYHYNGSHKHLIVMRATPYTDASFDRSQRFSAFSSFKMLQGKGLINISNNSKCYLTREGADLCEIMFSNDTFNTIVDEEIKIVIDSREKKSNQDRNFFQAYFSTKGIQNQTRFLSLGDFVWVRNEKLIDVIVERKQTSDFASSVSDGRFRDQKNRLKSLGFTVFYLVENLKVDEERRKYINRCLLEVQTQGFIMIETESIQETAQVLEKIDQKIRSVDLESRMPMSYGSFLDEGSKNNMKVQDMLLLAFSSVKGLSKDLAIILSDKYKTISNFRSQIKEPNFKNTLLSLKISEKIITRIIYFFNS